jgi:hypothetical protein
MAREASSVGLKLYPEPPNFGIICHGHTFGLKISIMNIGKQPDRFRVSCNPNPNNENRILCTYAPIRLAPGMTAHIDVTVYAQIEGSSECTVKIQSVSSKVEIERLIKAIVISDDKYKVFCRSLRSQNLPIYAKGVHCLSADLQAKEFLAEYKLSPDDVLELSRMPVVQGTFYDPVEKTLCTDEELMKVVVDPSKSLERCIEETNDTWYYFDRNLLI